MRLNVIISFSLIFGCCFINKYRIKILYEKFLSRHAKNGYLVEYPAQLALHANVVLTRIEPPTFQFLQNLTTT
jgi:hypothetical protein